MFQNRSDDGGGPSALRGWLSDVFLPALVDRAQLNVSREGLARRLGQRAAVDDPLFGRAEGLPSLEARIAELSDWLLERNCAYERRRFTTGVDRDITEGVLSLTLESKTLELPVAVVAEKRRSREVEVRLYFATRAVIDGSPRPRGALVAGNPELPLPTAVVAFLDGLCRGDVEEVLRAFEPDGVVRESRGVSHKGTESLREFVEKLLAGGAFGGTDWVRGGAADDGRTCGLEYTLTRTCGRDVEPQAGLALFERGDSGLVRSLRLYDDVE